MRKAAVLLVSVAAVFILVGGVITQSLLILQRVAAVDDVKGTVWVKQRGQSEFEPFGQRERVAAGDTVRTEADASLSLHWLDGTRLRLGPNTVLTVLKCQINSMTQAETSMFRLDLGRVWIRILKTLTQKSKFEVMTPTATAGVRGTIFSVAVDPEGKTLVSVMEGKVALQDQGREGTVDSGRMAASGEVLEGLNPEEAALWEQNEAIAGPHLEIREPAAAVTVTPGALVDVRGMAEVDARVTVNGQEAPVRLRGLFSTAVTAPLKPGKFAIKVAAHDRRGFTSTREVEIVVK